MNYNTCWAKDVLKELGHDERDEKAVRWVLRWMKKHDLDPGECSVTTCADEMRAEFAQVTE